MKAGKLKKILELICQEYGDDIDVLMECKDDCEINDVVHVKGVSRDGEESFEEIRLTDDSDWLTEIYDYDTLGSLEMITLTNREKYKEV